MNCKIHQPSAANNIFLAEIALKRRGETMLGERAWHLFKSYGRVMSGTHGGRYVSGMPHDEQEELICRLVAGDLVDVHLMHMYRSGDDDFSALRWTDGQLVMVYADREVLA